MATIITLLMCTQFKAMRLNIMSTGNVLLCLVMVDLIRCWPKRHAIVLKTLRTEISLRTIRPGLSMMSLDIKVPIRSPKKDYKGPLYSVVLLWDDVSETYESLETVIKDDPVTLAYYALKHYLLGRPARKNLKTIVTNLQCNRSIFQ
jgi:hypothetical protein